MESINRPVYNPIEKQFRRIDHNETNFRAKGMRAVGSGFIKRNDEKDLIIIAQ